jgi:hypothetical protein
MFELELSRLQVRAFPSPKIEPESSLKLNFLKDTITVINADKEGKKNKAKAVV